MYRTPRDRGVAFAPLAQTDSDEASEQHEQVDEVHERWEVLNTKERFRSHIQDILRHSAAIEEGEEDDSGGLLQAQPQAQLHHQRIFHQATYDRVQDTAEIPSIGPQSLDIAELSGLPESFAPTSYKDPYWTTDAEKELVSMTPDHDDKVLYFGPQVTTVELDNQDEHKHPPPDGPHYKPFVLGRTFVIAIFLAIIVLLALTAVAIQELPDSTQGNVINARFRNTTLVESRAFSHTVRRSKAWFQFQARHNEPVGEGDSSGDSTTSTLSTSSTSTSPKSPTFTSSSTATLAATTSDDPRTRITQPNTEKTTADTAPTTTSDRTGDRDSVTHTDDATTASAVTSDRERPTGDRGGTTRTDDATTASTATSDRGRPTGDRGETTRTDDATTASTATSDRERPTGDRDSTTYTDERTDKHSTQSRTSSAEDTPSPTGDESGDKTTSTDQRFPGHEKTGVSFTTARSTFTSDNAQNTQPTGGKGDGAGTDPTTTLGPSQDPPGDDGSQVTCTWTMMVTYTKWNTIPVTTVTAIVGRLGKRALDLGPSKMPRQLLKACDVTVTVTNTMAETHVTALSTITEGLLPIGGGATTNNPGDPTRTDPANPTQTDPGDPTQTDPGNPTQADPGDPTQTDPGNPTPTDPANPAPTDPGDPTQADPGDPTQTDPGNPTPTDPANPAPTDPGDPTQADPGDPTQTDPGNPTPTDPGNPAPTDPGNPTQTDPGDPTQTDPGEGTSVNNPGGTTQTVGEGLTTIIGQVTGVIGKVTSAVGRVTSDLEELTSPIQVYPTVTDGGNPPPPPTDGATPTIANNIPAQGTVTNGNTPTGATPTGSNDAGGSMTLPAYIPTGATSDKTSPEWTTIAQVAIPPASDDDDISNPNKASETKQVTDTAVPNATSTGAEVGVAETDTNPDPDGKLLGPTVTTIPPKPTPTVVNVVEVSTIVNTLVSTVTPSAAGTAGSDGQESEGNGVGGVFLTHVLQTSMVHITRLATQNVLYGDMTDADDVALATWAETIYDDAGNPTATVGSQKYGYLATITMRDSSGRPTGTTTQVVLKQPSVLTYTDSQGRTRTKSYYQSSQWTTLSDQYGQPTLTAMVAITETPTVVTLYDSNHHPTLTATSMQPDGTSTMTVLVRPPTATNSSSAAVAFHQQAVRISSGQYFVGLLLPTLLAVALAVPVRILDQTVKLYQPFSVLATHYGIDAAHSLCLNTTGLWGLITSLNTAGLLGLITGFGRLITGVASPQPSNGLLVVSGLLTVTSSILVALSTEVLRFGVNRSDCTSISSPSSLASTSKTNSTGTGTSTQVCPAYLSIVPGPANAVVGLFCFMAVLVLVAALRLRRFCSGVRNTDSPWSLYSMNKLASHPDIQMLMKSLHPEDNKIKRPDAIRAFGERRYQLGWWHEGNVHTTIADSKSSITAPTSSDGNSSDGGSDGGGAYGGWTYSIMIQNDAGPLPKIVGDKNRNNQNRRRNVFTRSMPFFTLSLTGKALFLLFQLALLLVILLYNNTGGNFQSFMNSGSFGGRFVLALAGVVVSIWWWTFFTCVAFVSPYRLLSKNHNERRLVDIGPPSNPMSGLWQVVTRKHPDIYLGFVAFAAILSDVLPTFLANVPYEAVVEARVSTACTWLAASMLSVMVLLMIWSFSITWPHLPIDPSTIAGGMYCSTNPNETFLNGQRMDVKQSPV